MLEVFIAILLITGSLVLLTKTKEVDIEEIELQMHDKMIPILREIQTNNTMRDSVLNTDISSNPIEWDNFETSGLILVKNKIINMTPSGFNCQGKLCNLNESCSLIITEKNDVFAETAFISADLDDYAPRQLKIFCWQK